MGERLIDIVGCALGLDRSEFGTSAGDLVDFCPAEK